MSSLDSAPPATPVAAAPQGRLDPRVLRLLVPQLQQLRRTEEFSHLSHRSSATADMSGSDPDMSAPDTSARDSGATKPGPGTPKDPSGHRRGGFAPEWHAGVL